MSQPVIISAPGDQVAEYHDGVYLRLPSGIVLGSTDTDGVEWRLNDVDGWDTVSSTSAITQRAYADGGWMNRAFLAPRNIAITGEIRTPYVDRPRLAEAVDRLITSIPVDELQQFTLHKDTQERYILARGAQDQIPRWVQADLVQFSLQLVAPDPRKFDAGYPVIESTPLPTTVGGLTIPFQAGFNIPAVASSGELNFMNRGNTISPAVLRVRGPVSQPTIRHAQQGKEMTFDLTLGEYDYLEIDLDTRAVTLNGSASRRGSMKGQWFDIVPGLNTLAFASLTYDPAALLTITTRHAYK